MNIPELTSASSIRSGQGEIREQTGWEEEGDGGAKRQREWGKKKSSKNQEFKQSSAMFRS